MKHVVDIRHQAMKDRRPRGTANEQGEASVFGLERAPGPGEAGRPRAC